MTLLFRLSTAALLLALASASHAQLKLNGVAVYSPLSQDQFIGAVYAADVTDDARSLLLSDSDKAMEVRVLADTLYARRFKRLWIEGIAINAGALELEQHAQHLATFSNLLRINLKAGDIVRIERDADTSTSFFINGYPLGSVADDRFFDLLLRTWIGPVPLSSEFKDAIVAGGRVSQELRAQLERVSPSAERIAAVSAAMESTEQPIPAAKQETSNQDEQKTASAAKADTPSSAVEPTEAPEQPDADDAQAGATVDGPATEAEGRQTGEKQLLADNGEDSAVTAEDLLAEQVYIAKLTKWTSSYVEYPRAALRNNLEGNVRVVVSIGRDGKLKDIQLSQKSEHDHLNRAAIQAARRASPYPAVPDAIKGETFHFTVPIGFRLR